MGWFFMFSTSLKEIGEKARWSNSRFVWGSSHNPKSCSVGQKWSFSVIYIQDIAIANLESSYSSCLEIAPIYCLRPKLVHLWCSFIVLSKAFNIRKNSDFSTLFAALAFVIHQSVASTNATISSETGSKILTFSHAVSFLSTIGNPSDDLLKHNIIVK